MWHKSLNLPHSPFIISFNISAPIFSQYSTPSMFSFFLNTFWFFKPLKYQRIPKFLEKSSTDTGTTCKLKTQKHVKVMPCSDFVGGQNSIAAWVSRGVNMFFCDSGEMGVVQEEAGVCVCVCETSILQWQHEDKRIRLSCGGCVLWNVPCFARVSLLYPGNSQFIVVV